VSSSTIAESTRIITKIYHKPKPTEKSTVENQKKKKTHRKSTKSKEEYIWRLTKERLTERERDQGRECACRRLRGKYPKKTPKINTQTVSVCEE
jgi:hypothetical protein